MADQYADDFLRLNGLFEPMFVQAPDGFYTERLVIDTPITAGYVTEASDPMAATVVEWHTEPCVEPKFKTELRWELEI